jgi:hypothetical protein
LSSALSKRSISLFWRYSLQSANVTRLLSQAVQLFLRLADTVSIRKRQRSLKQLSFFIKELPHFARSARDAFNVYLCTRSACESARCETTPMVQHSSLGSSFREAGGTQNSPTRVINKEKNRHKNIQGLEGYFAVAAGDMGQRRRGVVPVRLPHPSLTSSPIES